MRQRPDRKVSGGGASAGAAQSRTRADKEITGLHHVDDVQPGIRRHRHGRAFSYTLPDGQPVRDEQTLRRIRSLVIPPAWRDVWICPDPEGHIQATARDARGRKQYRYHPRWREARDLEKYHSLVPFGRALPAIRERVDADLRRKELDCSRVAAAVARLLETSLIRVGNREYAATNGSYGLSTMTKRHIHVAGHTVRFAFNGKSGKRHKVAVKDPRVAKVVARCRAQRGREVFRYQDERGEWHCLESAKVNAYIREASQEDFTAKEFRTWAGTVAAVAELKECPVPGTQREAKAQQLRAATAAADLLGNTVAVCRASYIHPAVFSSYVSGELQRLCQRATKQIDGLSSDESLTLALLERSAAC